MTNKPPIFKTKAFFLKIRKKALVICEFFAYLFTPKQLTINSITMTKIACKSDNQA